MKKLLLLISFFFTYTNPTFAESSKEILSKALTISNSINQNLTVEQKLSRYENIQNLIDKILSEYSGSDESIKIISGESIGNFNYGSIQNDYLRELTSYYETVCVVSPTFECIAFVSLNQGVNSCKNSRTFKQLDLSHKEIKNALNIFNSQDSKDNYKSLALNSYRNCLSNSKVKRTSSIQDYFSSNLVPMFLSLNKKNEAKAIVQQLEDPYLKFASVIEITKSEDNGISMEFFTRMREYIDNKMNYENYSFDQRDKWKKVKNLALLKLKTEMLSNAKFPIEQERDLHYPISWQLDSRDIENGFGTCSSEYNNEYFNAVIDLLDSSITVSKNLSVSGNSWNLERIMHSIRFDQRNAYFDICSNSNDKKDYGKAINIYSRIGMFDYEDGKKFLNAAAVSNYDSNEMMEYYFLFERTYPEFTSGLSVAYRTKRLERLKKRGSNQRIIDKLSQNRGSQPPIYDSFYTFKKNVADDKMCEAIDVLFKKFKGTQNYNRAINYLIDSPDVNKDRKYDCGDSSLETLLN